MDKEGVAKCGEHNCCEFATNGATVIRYYSDYCLATAAAEAALMPVAGTDSSSQRSNKTNELD